jgi:hypothetical protein
VLNRLKKGLSTDRNSSGSAEIVQRRTPGDHRQAPAKLLKRSFPSGELRSGSFATPELMDLQRQRLDSPNEPDELASCAGRIECGGVADRRHR